MTSQGNLLKIDRNHRGIEYLADYTALLVLMEMGLGSILHALRLPFTGYFLSLNQIFLMTRLCEKIPQRTTFDPAWMGLLAAAAKSLAPLGKKLTPMLAISMQGVLFNLGVLFFGNGRLGWLSGAVLASTWGFLQPFLIYYALFGQSAIDAYFDAFQILQNATLGILPDFTSVLCVCVLLKMLLAAGIVLFSASRHEHVLVTLAKKGLPYSKAKGRKTPLWGAVSDLFAWPFLLTLSVTGLFFWQSSGEFVPVIWHLMRPVAAGFILFYFLRLLGLSSVLQWVERYAPARIKRVIQRVFQRGFQGDHLQQDGLSSDGSYFDRT